jgi:hypothetical protein
MKKISKQQMKKIWGGNVASCSIKCEDQQFHSVDCGANACETTSNNTINCTSGTTIVSNTDPCKKTSE